MSTLSALVALALVACVSGHGMLLRPVSRFAMNAPRGINSSFAFKWYTQRARVDKVTNCDKTYRTLGVSCDSKAPGAVDWPCTPGAAVPWCAPGSAAVKSPCGVFAGGFNFDGRDMLDLEPAMADTWVAGEEAEVVWNIVANHGGGYSYRLCPASGDLTEECFQSNHLDFASDSQFLVHKGATDKPLSNWTAVRLNKGTTPKGSTWTRNPVSMEVDTLPPIPNFPEIRGRGPFEYGVMDKVKVPANLPAGDYVLSFRWDSEQVQQVWSQCSDVKIVANPKAKTNVRAVADPNAKFLANGPRPKPFNVCVNESVSLSVNECNIWGQIYDTLLDGKAAVTPEFRANPCMASDASKEEDWNIYIVCASARDMTHITELYLLGPEIAGPFPDPVIGLSHLVALSLASTSIKGAIPEGLGFLPDLKMLWLDHNPHMTGPIPSSFERLGKQLDVLEMHYSTALSGTTLPPMGFRNITDCTLNGLVFKCPLPEGAETCGCSCK
eukprot:m.476717 g.476717  ORF g.476717 m.476717 type:complete len:496 (+) comp20624_c0_seq1:318-1805(+)